jgi:heme A synthase
MVDLGIAAGMIAPYYNLAMVVVAVWLFLALFKTEPKAKVFLFPWKLLFFAVIVFIVEEILTVLRSAGVIDIPVHINAFFELVIIAVFIYALLLQKEYVKKRFG